MKFSYKVFSIVLSVIIGFSSTVIYANENNSDDDIEEIISKMSVKDKVTQMIIPGFRQYKDEDGITHDLTSITKDLKDLYEDYQLGGMCFFAENIKTEEQAIRLIDELQCANLQGGASRTQLMFTIDQEGGSVTRILTGTMTPGNMALGATGNNEYCKEAGRILGEESFAMGFDLDFAPVLDINNNPSNPVINIRSFSDKPQTVADMGSAFMCGLKSTGMGSALKHFPGHGDTSVDSHSGFPVVNKTYEQLKNFELIPFQRCINKGTDAVMTAHIQYPLIEKETCTSITTKEKVYLPATLSKTIITDKLRKDMGFEGIVVTDSMSMGAITNNFEELDAVKRAINAGVDIILYGQTKEISKFRDHLDNIVKMVKNGDISEDNVNASTRRILKYKKSKGKLTPYDHSKLEEKIAHAESVVGSEKNHTAEWQIALSSVTMVKNEDNVLPLTNENETIAFFVPDSDEIWSMQYAVDKLKTEDKLPLGANYEYYSFEKNYDPYVLIAAAEKANNVFIVSEVYDSSEYDPNGSKGTNSNLTDKLIQAAHIGGGKAIILSCKLPYDVSRYQNADALLICYSPRTISEDPRTAVGKYKFSPNLSAGAYIAMAYKENYPCGKLPINIPKLNNDYTYSENILYPNGYGLNYEASPIPDPSSAEENSESSGIIEEENTVSNTSSQIDPKKRGKAVATGQPFCIALVLFVSIIALTAVIVMCKSKKSR